jgi:hypothetical protein
MDAAVKILLTEVKYEVKFDSWLLAKVTNAQAKNANKAAKPVGYAYDNDKAEDWLVRQIQDAVDMVYGKCAWCTHDDTHFDTDEILKNPTEWAIHFRFAPTWRGSVRALKRHIHRYVCDYVLSRWYLSAKPDEAVLYAQSADDALQRVVNEARNERVCLEPWRL